MSKITLSSVSDLTQTTSAQTTINANSSTVQTAFDNTLSRDGTSPNQMGATLDMNSNQIINLPAPSTQNSPARLIDVVSNPTIVVPGTGTSGHVVPFLDGNNTWSGTNTFNGNNTFTGTNTYSNTSTFSNTATFNNPAIFNGTVTLPANTVTYANLTPATQFLNNARLAKTTNYTVVNADKGSTVALGGSAFYTLTISAASGYDSNFSILVLNEDTGRGKTMAINGLTSFILWPGQSTIVYNQNNVWKYTNPGLWNIPNSTTVFVDITNGNDSNDGLAAGTGNALATSAKAMSNVSNFFIVSSNLTIKYANGTYTDVPFLAQRYTGSGQIIVQGDTATPTNVVMSGAVTVPGGGLFNFGGNVGGTWTVQGFQVTASLANLQGIVASGAVTINYGNMNFGSMSGSASAHIAGVYAPNINSIGNNTISGGAGSHASATDGCNIHITTGTTTLTGTPAFATAFLISHGAGAVVGAPASAFSGAATGSRFKADLLALIDTGGTSGSLPGNSAGSPTAGTLGTDGAFVL